jgi:hypothetical protein
MQAQWERWLSRSSSHGTSTTFRLGCWSPCRLGLPPVKSIEQGAATSVLLAASPDVESVTGRYYEDCAEATPITERAGHTGGVAPYALNVDNAERLWEVSVELTQKADTPD